MHEEDESRQRAADSLYKLQEIKEAIYLIPLDHETSQDIKEQRTLYMNSMLEKGYSFKDIGGYQKVLQSLYQKHGIYFGFFEKEGDIYIFCRGTDPELLDPSLPQNIDKVQPGFSPIDQIREKLRVLFLFYFSGYKRFIFMGHSMGASIATHLLGIFLSVWKRDAEIDLVLFQPAPLSERVAAMVKNNISEGKELYITDFRCTKDLLKLVQDVPYSSITGANYVRVVVNRENPHGAFPYDEEPGALFGTPSEDKAFQTQKLLSEGEWVVLKKDEGYDDIWHHGQKSKVVNFLRGCVPRFIISCLQSCWLCGSPCVRSCLSPVSAIKRRISPPVASTERLLEEPPNFQLNRQ